MAKVFCFDVDDSLEISNGPITLQSMMDLRIQGHIVGLCGNWSGFVQKVTGWQHLISFMNVGTTKEELLTYLKHYVPCDEVIMVGNVFGVKNKLSFAGGSDDKGAAERAGVRFIKEDDFANGER